MEIIRLENIKIVDKVTDWKDSINQSAGLLLDSGYIEQTYIDAIFASTETNGAYYVLAPEIALPHASADLGVKESQISLLVVKEAFKFSEESFDVRLVFTLASKDKEAHMKYLKVLSALFSDKSLVDTLISANDSKVIYDLLNSLQ